MRECCVNKYVRAERVSEQSVFPEVHRDLSRRIEKIERHSRHSHGALIQPLLLYNTIATTTTIITVSQNSSPRNERRPLLASTANLPDVQPKSDLQYILPVAIKRVGIAL